MKSNSKYFYFKIYNKKYNSINLYLLIELVVGDVVLGVKGLFSDQDMLPLPNLWDNTEKHT